MLSFISTLSVISTLCHWLCFRARLKGNIVLVGTIIGFIRFRHTLSKRKIAEKSTRELFLPLCDHRTGQTQHHQELNCWSVTSRQGPWMFIFLVPARNVRSYSRGQSDHHHHHHHPCFKRQTATYWKRYQILPWVENFLVTLGLCDGTNLECPFHL